MVFAAPFSRILSCSPASLGSSVRKKVNAPSKSDWAEQAGNRPLFGRQFGLNYLLDRTRITGITAVLGRPQEGKT